MQLFSLLSKNWKARCRRQLEGARNELEFHKFSTTFQVALYMRPQKGVQKLILDIQFDFLSIAVKTM
jgi:hypothetical protein